jgi:hypothetical protein
MKNAAVALLCIIAFLGWWKYLEYRIRGGMADDQTKYFSEVVLQAYDLKTIKEIEEHIEAIQLYYPSGGKQRVGSHLDRIVERARVGAIDQLRRRAELLRSNAIPQKSGERG